MPEPDHPEGPEPPERGQGDPFESTEAADAAWRAIIDNYGDRPDVPDLPAPPPPPSYDVEPSAWEPTEHYQPPEPPPAPVPNSPRGVAWVAMLGAPVLFLVLIAVHVPLPSWAVLLLGVAFVGGLGYLVATMPRHDDTDPFDDGAVL